MNIESLKQKHWKAIDLLEAIEYYERRKVSINENINGFAGTFPKLKAKNIHELDIMDRCINRLTKSYSNLF